MEDDRVDLKSVIRNVKDFPKPGIVFRDITPLLSDPPAFKYAVDKIADFARGRKADLLLAVEARGFTFGAAVAYKLALPLVVVRKPGKLPYKTVSHTYDLEYGTDTLHIHEDAVGRGKRVLIVDDLLATGGTVQACARLVEKLGGSVAGAAFVIELSFLKGRDKLKGYDVYTIVDYESE
jgi:adenine phosphoribosyltransferase